jgi:hypothetical protein
MEENAWSHIKFLALLEMESLIGSQILQNV